MDDFVLTVLGHVIGPFAHKAAEHAWGQYKNAKGWATGAAHLAIAICICVGFSCFAAILYVQRNSLFVLFACVAAVSLLLVFVVISNILRAFEAVCNSFEEILKSLNSNPSEHGAKKASQKDSDVVSLH